MKCSTELNTKTDMLDKPVVIKKECSDVGNYVIEVTCLKNEGNDNERIASIKYEELHIKDESDTGEEGTELVPTGDFISSGTNGPSEMKNRSASKIKKQHFCPECRFSSEYDNEVKMHIAYTHHSAVHKCSLCAFVTDTKLLLKAHLMKHKASTMAFGCTKCLYKAESVGHMRMHMLKHKDKSEVEMYKCPLCPFQSKYKGSVGKHRKTQHDKQLGIKSSNKDKIFKCCYCDYNGTQKSSLSRHISVIHERDKAKVYDCRQCTFKTVHSGSFRVHCRQHGEKVTYKCSGCGREFNKKITLDNHLLRNHDDLQRLITNTIYHCQFCSFKSTISGHLSQHRIIHDRENAKAFTCHACDYFSFRKIYLERHLLIHTKFRPKP